MTDTTQLKFTDGGPYEELVVVRFNDGTHGLLPADKLEALSELLEYNWDNEELDFEQCGDSGFPQEDEGVRERHIVHAYRALGYFITEVPAPDGETIVVEFET